MVALFVAFMFVSLVLVDLSMEKWKVWQASRSAQAALAHAMFMPQGLWRIPDGVQISNAHTWFRPDPAGGLEIGADALIAYAVGAVRKIVLPKPGDHVSKGQPLFRLVHNGAIMTVPSSVTGRVMAVNTRLAEEPQLLSADPYGNGWICYVKPTLDEKPALFTRLGADARAWLDNEFGRFRDFVLTQASPELAVGATSQDGGLPAAGCLGELSPETWSSFEDQFLSQ